MTGVFWSAPWSDDLCGGGEAAWPLGIPVCDEVETAALSLGDVSHLPGCNWIVVCVVVEMKFQIRMNMRPSCVDDRKALGCTLSAWRHLCSGK